jgi:hypothetical protein
MINIATIFFALILLIPVSTFEKNNRSHKNRQFEIKTYMNPVYSYSLPDPTVIKAADGYLYHCGRSLSKPFWSLFEQIRSEHER